MPKTQKDKQTEAMERATEREKRTNQEQIRLLDQRPGNATKERGKLRRSTT